MADYFDDSGIDRQTENFPISMNPNAHKLDDESHSEITLCSRISMDTSIDDIDNVNSLSVKTEPSAQLASTRCNRIGRLAIPLLLGQLLAGLIGVTAVCSTLLVNNNVSLPLAQNLPLYLLLTLCYGLPRLICLLKNRTNHHRQPETYSDTEQVQWCKPFSSRYFWYAVAGFIDVHANWAIVSAYAYTSVTSIQLLDCITIPTTVILSYFFLNNRYLWNHYVSLVLCFIGAIGMVLTDYLTAVQNTNTTIVSNETTHVSPMFSAQDMILGDFLVILGVIAYGFSNVMQQYLVVKYGFIDFLGFMGLSGLIPITIYSFSIEWNQIKWVFLDPTSPTAANLGPILGYFGGYLAAMFLLYSIMPYALAQSSAVLVNLSLLTADVYALLMGIFLFHYQFHMFYIICFVVILFGVGLFNIKQPIIVTDQKNCCVRFFNKFHSSNKSCNSNVPDLGESCDLQKT